MNLYKKLLLIGFGALLFSESSLANLFAARGLRNSCVIGVAEAWWQVDLAEGWQHDVLGLALFVFSFVALISTDILLEFTLGNIPDLTFANTKNWLIHTWNFVVGLGTSPERSASAANVQRQSVLANLPTGKLLLGCVPPLRPVGEIDEIPERERLL